MRKFWFFIKGIFVSYLEDKLVRKEIEKDGLQTFLTNHLDD